MPVTDDQTERAVAAFRARVAAADVPLDDPEAAGTEAADFAVARHGRREVARRVGKIYYTDDLARYLVGPGRSMTTEAVRKRAKRRQLVSFTSNDGLWVFPTWQFALSGGRLEPIEDVIRLWQRLPHDSAMDALDLVMWANTEMRWLGGDTPARRATTHGIDDPSLTRAISRLRGRVAGPAA